MKFVSVISLVSASILSSLVPIAHAAEVNIYSGRQEELVKPLLDKFSAQTGIKVNLITGKADELISRMVSEGRNSPADVLISSDVGRLYRAKQQQVLQSVQSDTLTSTIPSALRDPNGYWYGLTMRARPIMYVTGKVDPAELSTYADLASPKWKGRICVRSSNNIYNQSLTASFIAHDGAEATAKWAQGFVANFAQPPRGGDRDQIKAAAAGVCDIAIANTYYLAGMLADDSQKQIAQKVSVFWPNQTTDGVHVNISGAGVAKYAPNKTEAIKLLEFMTTAEAQQWYAEANHEYSIRDDVPASEILQRFGDFKADTLQLENLGELNADAIRLMDRAGWK
ncbi:Fe(3+) ABC transporter substrate-binding protein [Rheinheimera sp. WS51]|uniref:Fe(3+) ABC transporter substrate-binding protein n=1 Tax=Rheinheimera sp. WS51 TaxID=3425886 RepID=UPI003D911C61